MEEIDSNDLMDYYPDPKKSFEEKLGNYKNRMELIRTLIGLLVLGIQFFILYHLYHSK